jgi:hypothetical protein
MDFFNQGAKLLFSFDIVKAKNERKTADFELKLEIELALKNDLAPVPERITPSPSSAGIPGQFSYWRPPIS